MTTTEKNSLARLCQAVEKMNGLKREVLLSLGCDLASLNAIEEAKKAIQKPA